LRPTRTVLQTGLFSAAVATLTSVSVQDLLPNPQDTTTFYLANIYQLLADPNAAVPLPLPSPPAFSPPKYAIWVNALWFLSLAISLTCALLATLLQQWARRYIKITQPQYNPHKRARIRAFFAEGVDNLHLPATVEALPALLHLSLFFFFAGFLVFLSNLNHTAFAMVAWWIGLCTAIYACITLMPIFRHDSPYYTPLSSSAWYIYTGALSVLFQVLHWFTVNIHGLQTTRFHFRFGDLEHLYRKWFLQGVKKTVEETARRPSAGIDNRALMSTFDSLDDDHELERFFAGVPGLCNSKVVHDPVGSFIEPNMSQLSESLAGLLDRTMTSNLVPEPVKQRRSIICMKAMDAISFPLDRWIFDRLFTEEWDGLLGSVEFGLFVMKARYDRPLPAFYSQSMVSIIIARVQERDHRWFELVTNQLGISELVLQNYMAHGDSVLLANLIYIARLSMVTYPIHHWSRRTDSRSKTFESVSKLNAQRTLPALQHVFCSLWNDLILSTRREGESPIYSLRLLILRHIRNIYITLHHGTFAAPTAFSDSTANDDPILYRTSSYPLCNVESHCVVPLNTVPYNPRVINTPTNHSVRSSSSGRFCTVLQCRSRSGNETSRYRSAVLARSESPIDLASPSHAPTPTSTNVVSPVIPPTYLPDSPSYPVPVPFTVFTPHTNAFPPSHDATHFTPELRLTPNTSGTHNPSSIGDYVNPLAVQPEVVPTDGASQRADAQSLSDSPIPTFPTSATVPSTSIAALAPGVSQGSAVSESSVVSNMEMLGRRENTQASNIGSQSFAVHHPRGSTSAFAVIPMEPILSPEDLDSSGDHGYPPLQVPEASEAQR
jgi:hypothetical protein